MPHLYQSVTGSPRMSRCAIRVAPFLTVDPARAGGFRVVIVGSSGGRRSLHTNAIRLLL